MSSPLACYALIRGGIKKGALFSMNAVLFNFDATTICCGHAILAMVLLAAINAKYRAPFIYWDSHNLYEL
jgi:hypothetical protein